MNSSSIATIFPVKTETSAVHRTGHLRASPEINNGFILEGILPYASKDDVIHYACNDSWCFNRKSELHVSDHWCVDHASHVLQARECDHDHLRVNRRFHAAGSPSDGRGLLRGAWVEEEGARSPQIDDADDANNAVNSPSLSSHRTPSSRRSWYE